MRAHYKACEVTSTRNRAIPIGADVVQATRVGLRFPARTLDFEDWQQTGVRIARMADSSAWYLGDWLAYGESQFEGRYRRAVEAVGLSYQTLRNLAWVARRFPLARRRAALTLYHHMEVARLPEAEQERWLDRAVQERWSVRRLRLHIKSGNEPGASGPAVPTQVVRKISTERTKVDRWRAAADCAQTSLDDWILTTLDNAAGRLSDAQSAQSA
jgi:hypothetical protein